MRNLILAALFIATTFNCIGQKAIKDTTIDSITYHYAYYNSNGSLNALSQQQSKNKKEIGEWIYFNKKGEELWSGCYNKEGKKEGKWWYMKNDITIYKNGKIIGRGSGCKGCPAF